VGSEHHEVTLTSAAVTESVPSLLSRLDQPLADQALVATHAVAEFARSEVKVVVAGEGADELFGGYPRYAWLDRSARLGRWLPQGLSEWASRTLRAAPLGERPAQLSNVVSQAPLLERNHDWLTARRRELRAGLYGSRLRGYADSARMSFGAGAPELGQDPIHSLMRLDQEQWLPDDVLVKADRAGMLVSLEIRTPYLDQALAEFATSIPGTTHVGRSGKALLRGALAESALGAPSAPSRSRPPSGCVVRWRR
jgi:asparagine synthase (glutamine-hydrolysing)